MSEKEIKKIKNKFVFAASLSFLVVMLFISGFIYLFHFITTRSEARETLDLIIENGGNLPYQSVEESVGDKTGAAILPSDEKDDSSEAASKTAESSQTTLVENMQEQVQNMFYLGRRFTSAEAYYSTRYFTVTYDASEAVKEVETSHIAVVNEKEAVRFGNHILTARNSFGQIGDYYYKKQVKEDGCTLVVVLDCTEQIHAEKRLVNFVLILIGFGMLISILLMRALAGRVVKGEIRNMENQKSFITNASHELKTPLSVIKANTEIMELTSGETEWTQSTLRQIDRMTGLIQNLVMITRAQEKDAKEEFVLVDASKAVLETVRTFEAVATQDGKKMEYEIPEGIQKLGQEGSIRQLTSLLVDNAIKYCDQGGTIRVTLSKKGKNGIRLVVSNQYAAGKNVDYTRFFERFYREDQSHNQDKGGYGIGLSIAQNVCEQYRGTIKANWADGVITFTCILN